MNEILWKLGTPNAVQLMGLLALFLRHFDFLLLIFEWSGWLFHVHLMSFEEIYGRKFSCSTFHVSRNPSFHTFISKSMYSMRMWTIHSSTLSSNDKATSWTHDICNWFRKLWQSVTLECPTKFYQQKQKYSKLKLQRHK